VAPPEWESRGFSYPAALSLTTHLERRRGVDGLVRVLARLAEGELPDRALEEVYGSSYAEICRDWADRVLGESVR